MRPCTCQRTSCLPSTQYCRRCLVSCLPPAEVPFQTLQRSASCSGSCWVAISSQGRCQCSWGRCQTFSRHSCRTTTSQGLCPPAGAATWRPTMWHSTRICAVSRQQGVYHVAVSCGQLSLPQLAWQHALASQCSWAGAGVSSLAGRSTCSQHAPASAIGKTKAQVVRQAYIKPAQHAPGPAVRQLLQLLESEVPCLLNCACCVGFLQAPFQTACSPVSTTSTGPTLDSRC
jgi:hypothetical protein